TFVSGTTQSTDFPTRDAIQSTFAGGSTDAFVSKFDASGQLQYSTFLGGSADDAGRRLVVDPSGAVIVAGTTSSLDFPTRQALQFTNAGSDDVFIARIADGTPPADTVAPTTTIATSGMSGANGWFRSSVAVSLTAVDDPDGSGVALIQYSVNDGAFQRYDG